MTSRARLHRMGVAIAAVSFLFSLEIQAYKKPERPALPEVDKRRLKEPATLVNEAERQAAGEKLQSRVPRLRVDFDRQTGSPRYIASPESLLSGPQGRGKALSPRYDNPVSPTDSHYAVKTFLHEHRGLFGHNAQVLAETRLRRDFVTPHNGLRTVVWQQQLDGVPVYESVLLSHVTGEGALVSLSSTLLPELEAAARAGTPDRAALLAQPALDAEQAVMLAAEAIAEPVAWPDVLAIEDAPRGTERVQSFLAFPLPNDAALRLVWLPLDAGTLRLCWQVELTRPAGNERFRVLLDAATGELLLRRCLTVYLSDATYRVFLSDSPSPFSPSHPSPATNQPPLVPRQLITLAALNTNASLLGWISDGENETRGNNVDAHLDRNADDSPDLPRPQGVPFRVFDFPLELGQSPASYGQAAVVQLFYWCNFMHDRLYELGFTEAAGNFQKDNFGRGGLGGDAVLADAQDGSGVNNANFTPTYDGQAPRIQMFVFDGPDPDRDGDLDAEIILHEYTHGLSDRLVGGGVGISQLQTAGLGEGWSDFYALALLSEEGDDVDGCYAVGGYATWQFYGLAENYYYGIRRYPYTTDLAKNPLTFKDIDPTRADAHAGVPLNPIFGGGNPAEVHNQGEVWCVVLWEMRANLVRKHGFAAGNRMALQLVTDGMKLGPPNPDFLQARDAILLADQVNHGGANYNELWAAFAKRGMGFSARCPASTTTTGVDEAFDMPDALLIVTTGSPITSGPAGGPFSPHCHSYVLTNHTTQALAWTASIPVPWLQVSPVAGTLAGGMATNVSVCVTTNARALSRGVYYTSVAFANTTSGLVQWRDEQLRVMGFGGVPLVEDFESGALGPPWTVSGTGTYRTLVTAADAPHGGRYHLRMDTAVSGIAARNEATLGLDLAGYTNVVLEFWAKGINDEPDGPPPSPFVGGADFDGVAISADGILWYEVQSLRALPGSNVQFVVDLDAAIIARGLAYSPNFQIRFNQYDNNSVPYDGIAIDDISVTGLPARRLGLALPAEAAEDDGVLATQGRVSIGAPTTAALAVKLVSSDTTKLRVPASVTIPAGATSAVFNLTLVSNSQLDGTQPVIVTASAANCVAARADLLVQDDEWSLLWIDLPSEAAEGRGAVLQGSVHSLFGPTRDITVALASSDPGEASVPPTVVIPAGKFSAPFTVHIVDDAELDGTQTILVTARVPNWSGAARELQIRDNDPARLMVELPALASEGNGGIAGAGSVRISATVPTNLPVKLSSGNTNKLIVPGSVIIPAGRFSTPFDLTVADNPIIDGLTHVTVSATTAQFAKGSATIGILDDEIPLAPYQPYPPDRAENQPLSLRLAWRSGVGELVVNGDFETGRFDGWTRVNGGFGEFLINDGTVDPEGPDGALPPFAGRFAALSQQIGGGGHEIYQDVMIPSGAKSARLSWVDRIRNHAERFASPNQEFRMELRDPDNAVLEVLYQTQPGDTLRADWVQREFDITRYRGQTIRLAFVELDNLGYFNLHLDNISVWLEDTGTTTYDLYVGTSPELGEEEFFGNVTNTFWDLPRLGLNATYYWKVVSHRGDAVTAGPVWRFSTRGVGGAHRLEFGPVPSPVTLNQPVPVTLTALDDLGNVATNFAETVSLRGKAGAGSAATVVISEIDPNTYDRVEFANVSGRDLDISGWQATIYDGRSWPLPRINFVIPTNVVCRANELFIVNKSGTAPGTYPHFFTGTNFFWATIAYSNNIAVLLRDAAGNVVDFACVHDSYPGLITHPIAIPAGEWSGLPLPLNTNANFTYQRVGEADHNDARDWIVNTNSVNSWTPDLGPVFQDQRAVSLQPTVASNFVQGVWSGAVTIEQPVDQMTLEAATASGLNAATEPFRVMGSNDLAVTLVGLPNLVMLGGPITYAITVSNTGPDAAAAVQLTNRLPAELELVSFTNTQGTCRLIPEGLAWDLGELSGGARAVVTLVTKTTVAGTITNGATVTRAGPDGYEGNNTVQAVSTVALPMLVVLDATVTERDKDPTNAVFSVRLSAPPQRPVTVEFTTSNWTATAGADYGAVAGTLTFPPGVVTQSVVVPVFGDLLDEATRYYYMVLANPTNATLADNVGVGRIYDNDPTPSLRIHDVTVTEGAAGESNLAHFRVTLSAVSGELVAVNYATSNGTATAESDYVLQSGTLEFPPGVTNQTVSVPIVGDRLYETNETFSVVLAAPANAALARGQASATILDDDAGELAGFEIDPVPSPRYAGTPFPVTLTARDGMGRVVTNFTGPVALRGVPRGEEITLGTGTNTWQYPLAASYHDARLQALYPASEIGRTGSVISLSLLVAAPPGQTLSNWTIRLKPSPLTHYVRGAWEADGWTVVFQRDQKVVGNGWTTFLFDTPFNWNGTDSLMVDFSFNNATWSSDGFCRAFNTSQARSVYFETDSAFGDPTQWTGPAPPPALASQVPMLRLNLGEPVALAPTNATEFVAGVWAGDAVILGAVSNLFLRAADGEGHLGVGNDFAVEPGTDTDNDGLPDAWEWRYFGALTEDPNDDSDRDGIANQTELRAGSNPILPAGLARINAVQKQGADLVIAFLSEWGRPYQVERADTLDSGSWSSLGDRVTGTGGELRVIDANGASRSQAFYRVRRL